jgi:radical SAM protein with 4Fe4S-binding SPASM domain
MKPLPDSICAVPWINLSLDVDGSSRPCCKFEHASDRSPYQLANLKDGTLADVWNSDGMVKLRRDFRNGVKPAECATCWREEDAGVRSYRQTFEEGRTTGVVDFDDLTPAAPVTLDVKLTNVCNLKCRICGPVASSLWLKEELAHPGEDAGFTAYVAENRDYFLSNKITGDPVNRDIFRAWIPHLEHIEMTGGEPLLSPENRAVVDMIVGEDAAHRVSLLLNTNVTIFDDRLVRQWQRFKSVKVCLSLDDIGRRFEYQRAPARWEDVRRNTLRYAEVASSQLRLYAFCSVNVFNVWYLPEYVAWLSDPALRTLELRLNYVHSPRSFCVQVLPEPVKRAVTARLTSRIVKAGYSGLVTRQIQGVIDFMNESAEGREAQWPLFLAETARRDAIRGEGFAAVFPELQDQLEAAARAASPAG